jgi:hypothetical protein
MGLLCRELIKELYGAIPLLISKNWERIFSTKLRALDRYRGGRYLVSGLPIHDAILRNITPFN